MGFKFRARQHAVGEMALQCINAVSREVLLFTRVWVLECLPAQRLDAMELTANFARSLVSRPVNPERPDRYAWYNYLTQHALKEGKTDEALAFLDEGERALHRVVSPWHQDCEGSRPAMMIGTTGEGKVVRLSAA